MAATEPAHRSVAPPWREGWWAAARPCPSPNFGPRPVPGASDVGLVVLHSISLPPGVFGGDSVARLFTNQLDWDAHPYFSLIRGLRVSAHFLVRRDGGLLQFVSCDQRAWHAGASLWRGRPDCNDWSIGIELEGLEGGVFEPPQYVALACLLGALAERYPITELVGHEHVAPGRKQDPGAGFDWLQLQSVTLSAGLAPGWQRRPEHPGLVRLAGQKGAESA